ncbi:MAG: NADPH-dependent assimilatory sulfite reductase hemoprotein subunit [Verrucomicrobiota bacterium]
MKDESHSLRGNIVDTIQSGATHFEDAEYQLLKFHGTYQQDDRDLRKQLRKEKKDKAWSFMVRSKMPAGRLTAEQYIAHDNLADSIGCGNLRLTTRQGIQLHGILIGDLKTVMATVTECGLTTWGACGDVVRNTMGPASPIKDTAHADAQALAEEINEIFLAKSTAYTEIWLDGEKLDVSSGANDAEESIYGKVYLPRKFKLAIAIPPRNDVDLYSQDVAFVPHLENDSVSGYTIYIGGGFGMTHGMTNTRPLLAKPFAYVERENVVAVTEAIVKVQRDHGNREDRKQSRMKYLVESKGLDWFTEQVKTHTDATLHPPKENHFDTVADQLGWHEQGDGKLFCGIYVAQGRIQNVEDGAQYKDAFRKLAEEIGCPTIVTPNTNIVAADIDPAQKDAVNAILANHNIVHTENFTEARKTAHACVALPTCGLSLAESERVFNGVLDQIDDILRELGIGKEPLLIRMTGCPNGCARPYNADIAFVGRGPNKYAFYVGGSSRGDRLAGLEEKVVTLDGIPDAVRPLLEDFATNRNDGESFTDFIGRTREIGPEPDSEQFHVEIEERRQKLAQA